MKYHSLILFLALTGPLTLSAAGSRSPAQTGVVLRFFNLVERGWPVDVLRKALTRSPVANRADAMIPMNPRSENFAWKRAPAPADILHPE